MIFKALAVSALSLAILSAQTWHGAAALTPVDNDASTGTTLYTLAKLTSQGRAVTLTTADTSGVIGIVQQNAGTSSRAGIAEIGQASCLFDGATTAGDYVQASSSVAGYCHDVGSVFPSSGTIVGRVLSTNGSAGTYSIFVFPAEIKGGSGGSGNYTLTAATTTILGGVKVPLSGALAIDGSGNITANVGTVSGTVAAGNDARILGALQKTSNLSDIGNAATALTNLGGVTSAQAAAAAPVQSIATKTGAVTLIHSDISDWAIATSWGGIGGTLANQSDLATALSGKLADPGANGIVKRTSAGVTAAAIGTDLPSGYPYASLSGPPTLGTAAAMAGPSGAIVGTSDIQTLTNKTVDGVSPATMAYVDPTSSIQTQLNATTNASNLTSGTLTAARLPAPTVSTLGGVKTVSCGAGNHVVSIDTTGTPSCGADSGSGGGYNTLQGNGSSVTQRTTENYSTEFTVADNSGSSRTDVSVSSIASTKISGLAASATTDTTNASNISTGTLGAGRLPNPTASTLGGTESLAATSHQWINSISTLGVPTSTQPAFSDILGAVAAAQLPNPSATTLGGTQSAAAVSHQWINSISTSGVPALSQPTFTDISGSVGAAQLPNPSASTLGGTQSIAASSHKWINAISTSGVPSQTQPAVADLSDGTTGSGAVALATSAALTTPALSNPSLGATAETISVANAGTTGTTVNKLVKLTGAPSTAVLAATTDTNGVIGVAVSGAGTTGSVQVARAGEVSCVFDGATTANDYVQISSTVAGNCHDTGATTYPTSGGQILGRVLSTNVGGGTYVMTVAGAELQVPAAPITLTDAATVATNAALSNYFRVTLGGNRTLAAPTNPTDGQKVMWEFVQDGTGSRTITLDPSFHFGTDVTGVTLTTTASKRDFMGAIYNAGTGFWYVVSFAKGY